MKENTPYLLFIETATEICSVAISHGEKVIALKESDEGYSHAGNLIPFTDNVLKDAGIAKSSLGGVVLSKGPGSYTGLRIGASAAKGLCYALDIPLVSLPTLQNCVMGARGKLMNMRVNKTLPLWYCPMIDARRMEVYTAFFDENGEMVKEAEALIVDANTFDELLQDRQIVFCGNGMPKCKEVIGNHPHAIYVDAPLSARNMAKKGYQKFICKEWEDVAYFEPFYLKEYVAVKSHVKGLE